MHLTKHHGLGNDFLVALSHRVPDDGAELAARWCHRTRGIGADGLIFVSPATNADHRMTLFNSDGSRAEMSGNGIRCLAHAVARADGVDEASLVVATDGGDRQLRITSARSSTCEVTVEMGAVEPGPSLPDNLDLAGVASNHVGVGSVGNPHLVIVADELADMAVVGPRIESQFGPDGVNVHVLTVAGPDTIVLAHWERGAGATAACGSGATVGAVLAHGWNLVGHEVNVQMPGGCAVVAVGPPARLTGPASFIASIEVPHG